jgi:hypothetical protein
MCAARPRHDDLGERRWHLVRGRPLPTARRALDAAVKPFVTAGRSTAGASPAGKRRAKKATAKRVRKTTAKKGGAKGAPAKSATTKSTTAKQVATATTRRSRRGPKLADIRAWAQANGHAVAGRGRLRPRRHRRLPSSQDAEPPGELTTSSADIRPTGIPHSRSAVSERRVAAPEPAQSSTAAARGSHARRLSKFSVDRGGEGAHKQPVPHHEHPPTAGSRAPVSPPHFNRTAALLPAGRHG